MFENAPTIADLLPAEISAEARQEITAITRQLPHTLTYLKILQRKPCDNDSFHLLINKLLGVEDSAWQEQILSAWIVGRAALTAEQKEIATHVLCSVVKNTPEMKSRRTTSRLVRARFSIILFLVSLLGGNARVDRVRAAAARALGHLCIPESVGTLALIVRDGPPQVCQAAAQALLTLLPTLTPEHYGQLDPDAVPNMCQALEHVDSEGGVYPEEVSLSVALIEALGKVGDGRAVKTIQHITEWGTSNECQEAARRVLPILVERQRKENEHQMLLRGAESVDS